MPSGQGRWAGLLFLIVAAGPIAHALVLILQHRFPAGHDGFQFFTTQWFFLNNAVQSGEIPQWMPFMTEGTVASFWYGIQATFGQNVLLGCGKLLRHFDLRDLLYWSQCVDELILAAGGWLLCRRFFRSRLTAIFVSTCLVGSTLWLDQVHWNFRLYFALPLMLHLGHRFLETGRWAYCFLCLNLLAAQTLGNLPYFIPVTSFVVCAYFAFYAACNWTEVRAQVLGLRWRWSSGFWIGLSLASLLCAYKFLTIGTDQLVNYNVGRTAQQTTEFPVFMRWGGKLDWRHWSEMLLGLSPWLDFSLYAGLLVVPLGLLGALALGRRRLHLLLTALLVTLFAQATLISMAAFIVWPMMQYFRHLSLVAPITKVMLCFVAGAGFEWLFLVESGRRRKLLAQVALAGAMVGLAVWLIRLATPERALACVRWLVVNQEVGLPRHAADAAQLIARLHYTAGVAVLFAVLLLLSGVMPVRARARAVWAWLAIGLATADIYHFKFNHLLARTDVMSQQGCELTRPCPLPFASYRAAEISDDSARVRQLSSFNQFEGVQYYTLNNFVFVDEVAHARTRADFWLRPFDRFLRVGFGEALTGLTARPGGTYITNFPYARAAGSMAVGLRFPLSSEPAKKFAGLSQPKLQFYSQAYEVASEDQLARLMGNATFRGDLLFLLPCGASAGTNCAPAWSGQRPLSASDRLELTPEVVRFDANDLVLRVTNTCPQRVWLYYSDVWHPDWHAEVNGTSVPLHRAAMAYKAVRLEPGPNTVRFWFGSRLMTFLFKVFTLQSLLWLGAVSWLILQILRGKEPVSGRAASAHRDGDSTACQAPKPTAN